ncbi:MAG: hypothetical protein ACFFEM_00920 [Candidatus Thorarchaeota archaeon]
MDRERYHRMIFLTAAVWNMILGAAFFILPRIDIGYFIATGLVIPNTLLWFDSFIGLVFIFGIGFYLVSKDMMENHGIIKMSLFEKNWVFIVGVAWFFLGQASFLVVAFVTVDFVLGLLFLEDLLAIRKMNQT